METKASIVVHAPNVPEAVAAHFKSSTGHGTEVLVPLKDLDPETLDRLCDEFRAEVFKKAGKRPPNAVGCAPK